MKIQFITLIILYLFFYKSHSQELAQKKDSSLVKKISNTILPKHILNSETIFASDYTGIEGTPYVENFSNNKSKIPIGKVYDFNMQFLGSALLRYNAYYDEMEISAINDGTNYYLLNKTPSKLIVKFGDKTYSTFFLNYKPSYFIVIPKQNISDKSLLLKKEKILYIKGEQQKNALVKNSSSRFKKVNDIFYLKIGERIVKLPKKNKKLFPLFTDKSIKIKEFTNKHKLKVKQKDDVLKIISYYNSLN